MPDGGSLPEIASKELSRKLLEGEAKLEQGSFEEAEVALREALSINNEVCFCTTCFCFLRGPLPWYTLSFWARILQFMARTCALNT